MRFNFEEMSMTEFVQFSFVADSFSPHFFIVRVFTLRYYIVQYKISVSLIQCVFFLRTYAALLSYLFSTKFIFRIQLIKCVRVPSIHKKKIRIKRTHTMSITITIFNRDLKRENHLSLFFFCIQQIFKWLWLQNAIKSIKFRLYLLQINVLWSYMNSVCARFCCFLLLLLLLFGYCLSCPLVRSDFNVFI